MNMCNESMVYLTKVFSNVIAKSCPLMSQLTADHLSFEQQLSFLDEQSGGCGCGCSCGCGSQSCFEINDDTEFAIESTEVFISDFDLADPSSLRPCGVTVDGLPVDKIDFFNERYMAATNDLMSRIGDCACMERGLSTKGYLLITNAGSWNAQLTIILRGSLFGCGGCRRFKLVLTTRDCVTIDIPGSSTFATDICLPCTTGGIAPIINFSFKASGKLLNPVLRPIPGSGQCALQLTGCLIAEPEAEIQVTRQTLFRTTAESVNTPCDDLARCNQTTPRCGDGDDDSNALQLRGRCCEEPCRDNEEEEAEGGCSCGGCDCESCRNRENRGNSCGCESCRNRTQARSENSRSITCQWNGGCGCNF